MTFDPQHPPQRQIADDDGAQHSYSMIPFAASEGWQIGTRLFALAGGPLGKVIDGLFAGGTKSNLDLGEALRDLAGALLASGSDGLVKALLRNSTRDGQPLDNPANFDRFYQANFGELAEALAWSVEVNGFHRFFKRLLTKASASGVAAKFLSAQQSSVRASQTAKG